VLGEQNAEFMNVQPMERRLQPTFGWGALVNRANRKQKYSNTANLDLRFPCAKYFLTSVFVYDQVSLKL